MSTNPTIDATQQTIEDNFSIALQFTHRLIHDEEDQRARSGFCSMMILFCEQYDVRWETEGFNELLDRLEKMPTYDFQAWLSSAFETIRQPREKFRHQPTTLELAQIA